MNIMRENIKLISQISQLRKKVKELDSQLKNHNCKLFPFYKTILAKMSKINQEQQLKQEEGASQMEPY